MGKDWQASNTAKGWQKKRKGKVKEEIMSMLWLAINK